MTGGLGDWFASNEALIQTALMSSLLAFSFQVAMRSGVFTFAGVGCWAIGGYTTGILVQHGWAPIPAIAASLALAAAAGLLLALILGRLRALYLAMVTVAFDLLVQILAQTLDVTGGANGLFGVPIVVGTGALFIVVAITCVVLRQRERGATGRMLEAMRVDEQLAPMLGISIMRQRIVAFVLSGVLAAMSGAMYVLMFSTLSPSQAGFELIVSTLTMVVIGGISSWTGPVIGAFVVTWMPDLLTFIGDWWPAVQGAIVVLMVIFAPDGLVGIARSAWRALASRAVSLRPVAAPR
jgi:branched-chain amino acid transport system permease protein